MRFYNGVRWIVNRGVSCLLELGPDGVLSAMVQECLADTEDSTSEGRAHPRVVSALRGIRPEAHALLAALAGLWVDGATVNWAKVFDRAIARGVALPTYAFQRRRYWLDAQGPRVADLAAAGQLAVEHPLLSAAIALSEGDGVRFTGRISVQDQPWLADHVLSGMVLVPGTTYVETALLAGAEVGCEIVEDLVHETPLILSERVAMQLQVSLGAPDEIGRRSVSIFTRPEQPAADGSWDQDTWTRHARGVLAPRANPGESATPLEQEAGTFAAGLWPPQGAEPVPIEDLYDYFAGLGLEYGSAFFGVQAAWRRGGEVFTELRLPEEECSRARSFNLHPALLDATIQSSAVYMLGGDAPQVERIGLPFAWRGVSVLAGGMSSLRVRVTHVPPDGISMVVADDQGRPVAAVGSLVLREVPAEQFASMRAARYHDALFHLQWVSAQADAGSDPSGSRDTWVWLGEKIVSTGATQEAREDLGRFDPGMTAYPDFGSLVAALDEGAAAPAVVFAHLGSDLIEQHEPPPSAARLLLERALSLMLGCLADARLQRTRLVFLTSGAVSVADDEGVSDLPGAAMWGLVRSAQSEHPGRFSLVDVDTAVGLPAAMVAASDTDEPQLALRKGELLVARLRPIVAGAGSPGMDADDIECSAHDAAVSDLADIGKTGSGKPGTVLITGGTGALGSLVARHLVSDHGVRSLLLASRRGPQAPGAEALEAELSELGAQVTLRACDVSDRKQLAQLLDGVANDLPLSAIVHTAGALDDGVIGSLTPERLAGVLAPKLDGAWYLHELTEELDLSAFILFSSISATIGSPGQGNYAAANAFLDSLASYRHDQGLPGVSLAWGAWALADGMAGELSSGDLARMRRGGMLSLSAEEGLSLFDDAYGAVGERSVIAARLDTAVFRAQEEPGIVPPLLRGWIRVPPQRALDGIAGLLVRRLTDTPAVERESVALELVRAEVAAVLGHSSLEEVDAQRPFSELGFDSLAAIELRNRLVAMSGVQLSATVVFDHPRRPLLSDTW